MNLPDKHKGALQIILVLYFSPAIASDLFTFIATSALNESVKQVKFSAKETACLKWKVA